MGTSDEYVYIARWIKKDGEICYLRGGKNWDNKWVSDLRLAKCYRLENHARSALANTGPWDDPFDRTINATPGMGSLIIPFRVPWDQSGEDIKVLKGRMTFEEVK